MRLARIIFAASYLTVQAVVLARLVPGVIAYASQYAPALSVAVGPALLLGVALSALALQGRAWAAMWSLILWVALASFRSDPMPWVPVAVLASVPLALLASGAAGGRPEIAMLGKAVGVVGLLALVPSAIIFAAYKLYMALPEALLPRAGGDLPALYEAAGHTLAFRLLMLSIAVFIAYKGLEIVYTTLVYYIARPPSLAALEVLRSLRDWRDTLIRMKRRQYGVLRWTQLFLLSTLLAPLFLPATRTLIYSLLPLQGRLATAAYIILGYILGWLFTRTLTAMLIDHPRPDQLLHARRPGDYLVVGVALAGLIIVAYAAAGGDPFQPVVEALTGRPAGPPSLANAIDIGSLEKSVISFARLIWGLLEGAVRFLWGG